MIFNENINSSTPLSEPVSHIFKNGEPFAIVEGDFVRTNPYKRTKWDQFLNSWPMKIGHDLLHPGARNLSRKDTASILRYAVQDEKAEVTVVSLNDQVAAENRELFVDGLRRFYHLPNNLIANIKQGNWKVVYAPSALWPLSIIGLMLTLLFSYPNLRGIRGLRGLRIILRKFSINDANLLELQFVAGQELGSKLYLLKVAAGSIVLGKNYKTDENRAKVLAEYLRAHNFTAAETNAVVNLFKTGKLRFNEVNEDATNRTQAPALDLNSAVIPQIEAAAKIYGPALTSATAIKFMNLNETEVANRARNLKLIESANYGLFWYRLAQQLMAEAEDQVLKNIQDKAAGWETRLNSMIPSAEVSMLQALLQRGYTKIDIEQYAAEVQHGGSFKQFVNSVVDDKILTPYVQERYKFIFPSTEKSPTGEPTDNYKKDAYNKSVSSVVSETKKFLFRTPMAMPRKGSFEDVMIDPYVIVRSNLPQTLHELISGQAHPDAAVTY